MSFSESPHSFRISTVCSPHFGAGPQISPIPIQTHSCQGLRFHLPLLQQYHLPRIHKRTVAPATALSLIIENSTFPLQSFEGKFKMSLQNAKTALRFSIPTLYLFLSILSVSGFSINRKSRSFLFPTQPVSLLRLLPHRRLPSPDELL